MKSRSITVTVRLAHDNARRASARDRGTARETTEVSGALESPYEDASLDEAPVVTIPMRRTPA